MALLIPFNLAVMIMTMRYCKKINKIKRQFLPKKKKASPTNLFIHRQHSAIVGIPNVLHWKSYDHLKCQSKDCVSQKQKRERRYYFDGKTRTMLGLSRTQPREHMVIIEVQIYGDVRVNSSYRRIRPYIRKRQGNCCRCQMWQRQMIISLFN